MVKLTMIYRGLVTAAFLVMSAGFAFAKPTILATFSILEDLIKKIVGDSMDVKALVPRMKDPHTYELRASDMIAIKEADLIIAYAPPFEGWLAQALEHYPGKLTFVAEKHPFRKLDDGSIDPHTWHDISMILTVVDELTRILCKRDPCHKEIFQNRAEIFKDKLHALDKTLKELFDSLPRPKRVVLTTHDAFWYFGKAYGITFLSPVGITTAEEPSAGTVAGIIHQIRHSNVGAIFIETLSNGAIVEKIASEVGQKVDGTLFADSLSEDDLANTYLKMVAFNAYTIHKALIQRQQKN